MTIWRFVKLWHNIWDWQSERARTHTHIHTRARKWKFNAISFTTFSLLQRRLLGTRPSLLGWESITSIVLRSHFRHLFRFYLAALTEQWPTKDRGSLDPNNQQSCWRECSRLVVCHHPTCSRRCWSRDLYTALAGVTCSHRNNCWQEN